MEAMTLHRACRALRCELCAWQRAALGLMLLARLDRDGSLRLDEMDEVC